MSTQQAQQAPNFNLSHVTGRPVSLSDYRGRPVVVMFGGRDSSDQVQQIGQTIRSRYDHEALPLVSILDLHGLPRMLQGMAKGRLQSGYQEAAQRAASNIQAAGQPVPADLSHLVVMAPDWDGKVTASFGLSGVDKQAVAVLVDAEGYIRGYGAGAQGGEQILSLFN